MLTNTSANTNDIIALWLNGAEVAFGEINPAGPLYVGADAAEAAIIDPELPHTGCSSCSGSLRSYCC